MSNPQPKECPECKSHDIGLRWGLLEFKHICRECNHEF